MRPLWTRAECCGVYRTGESLRIVDKAARLGGNQGNGYAEVYNETATIIAIISEYGGTETVFVCKLENPDPAVCARILRDQRLYLTQVACHAFHKPTPQLYRDDSKYVTLVMAGISPLYGMPAATNELWGTECTRCIDGYDYESTLFGARAKLVPTLKAFGDMPAALAKFQPLVHFGPFEPWHTNWPVPQDRDSMQRQLHALYVADAHEFDRFHLCDDDDDEPCGICDYDHKKLALSALLQAAPYPGELQQWQSHMYGVHAARHHRRHMAQADA